MGLTTSTYMSTAVPLPASLRTAEVRSRWVIRNFDLWKLRRCPDICQLSTSHVDEKLGVQCEPCECVRVCDKKLLFDA